MSGCTSPLVPTEDGSLTIRDRETDELYHNRAGAYTEALRNYFEPSAVARTLANAGRVDIIDACYGLGYNSLVAIAELLRLKLSGVVKILAIELDPLILNYAPDVLKDHRFAELSELFTDKPPKRFGTFTFTSENLTVEMQLVHGDLRRVVPELQEVEFDLVFHDAFSARKVPELWTTDLFKQYHRLLSPRKGKLLTYSCAGAVRGGLTEAGFTIYRTAALGGKKGGTLASVGEYSSAVVDGVYALFANERANLATGSGVPYRDSGFNASRSEILERRKGEQAERCGETGVF